MDLKEFNLKLSKLFGPRFKSLVPLGIMTTFKIGGNARYFVEARNTSELISAVKIAREYNVPHFILGGGSNILVKDQGFAGLVIKNNSKNIAVKGIKGNVKEGQTRKTAYIEADSGVILNQLVRFTIDQGLAGLQMHLGLPGTVGGAIYMNSKWTNPEAYVGDTVYQAKILTPQNQILTVPRSYFKFAYDFSIIQKTHDIVLSAVFALNVEDKRRLWDEANQSIEIRRLTQPHGQFSAGCIFKNITQTEAITRSTPNMTTSAGFLIDKTGAKGWRQGDAYVSSDHANFIINRGKAKASDVLKLIQKVKSTVKKNYHISLNEEIIIVG